MVVGRRSVGNGMVSSTANGRRRKDRLDEEDANSAEDTGEGDEAGLAGIAMSR
jgi:hypothetical protein